MKNTKSSKSNLLVLGVLTSLVLVIYWRAMGYGFISYDDLALLPGNPDRSIWNSWDIIGWIFTNNTLQDWNPVTWLSLLMDYYLFEFDPSAYHRTNILLYVLSVCFLFLALKSLTREHNLSFLVAAIFTVHPMHVESVVWISQRKDMLSSLFWMLTLWSYAKYAHTGTGSRAAWYLFVLILFSLGLMSKPSLVTLPIILLLLDYWPLQRWKNKEEQGGVGNKTRYRDSKRFFFFRFSPSSSFFILVIEKIPFFILTGISCYLTLWAVSVGSTGSVRTFEEVSWMSRFTNALVSYGLYVFKTITPYPLHFLYSQKDSFPLWQIVFSAIVVLSLSFFAIKKVKKTPYFFVGWFWFLVVFFPTLGFVQVGSQSMADRYAYFAHIGFLMMAVWTCRYLYVGENEGRAKKSLCFGILIVMIFSALSFMQVGYWRNSETLYKHTLKHDPHNFYIQEALCEELFHQKRYKEAVIHCEKAIKVDPTRAKVYQTLGRGYFEQKKYSESMRAFSKFLSLVIEVRMEAGKTLPMRVEGIKENFNKRFKRIVEQPDDPHGFYLMGNFWAQTKDYLLAVDTYSEALRLAPNSSEISVNLANVYFLMGEMKRAESQFKKALNIDPKNITTHFNYAIYLHSLNRRKEAKKHYEIVLKLKPNHIAAKEKLKKLN